MRSLSAILLSATLLLAWSARGEAQQQPTSVDVNGWRGARWGMRVDQVLAAFPGEARRLDSAQSAGKSIQGRGAALVIIDTVVLDGTKLSATFHFARPDSLNEVLLRHYDSSPISPSEHDYVRLLSLLTAKYGPRSASHEQRGRSVNLWSFWLLKSTTIELDYSLSQYAEMVSVWYRPPSSAKARL